MIHLTNEQSRVRIPSLKVRRLAVQILGKKNHRDCFGAANFQTNGVALAERVCPNRTAWTGARSAARYTER